ncbi:MAG: FAD-dependent oxidoreductase [Proteobacteria bacterium]|nr:FAD-dependent oxidoreductase [Pseudomonadota bacterium]
MKQAFRNEQGGRIDRSKPLGFVFNGKAMQGYSGDTLASALLANGVRIVSRSFKFHRPRGIVSAGVEESGGILAVDYGTGLQPIVRSTQMPLVDGLRAESQNCFPSLGFDLLRVFDYTRSLWPAGFYNKIFKWPDWHAFEWAIRRSAGLGRLPDSMSHARFCHMNAHCDVLVVGAGPAGLSAALQAARAGDDVMLVEQDNEPGSSLLHDLSEIDGQPPAAWLAGTLAELRGADNVKILTLATVAGYYDCNVVTIHDRVAAYRRDDPIEIFWKVRAGRVVLATGAIEQPIMFGNNDLPGIMLAGAMRQYANRYSVRCGGRIVAVVNNDLAWQSVAALPESGMEVAAIIDSRDSIDDALADQARQHGIDVYPGAAPIAASGSNGVRKLQYRDREGRSRTIECDAIAVSGGMSPTVHLYSQAGGRLRYDEQLACFLPRECRQEVTVTGAANGEFATARTYHIGPRKPSAAKTSCQWVDFLHDVTASDIELACRENLRSVEHVKRYTTTGMAADQGKTSNLNTLTLLGDLTGRSLGEVGTTTFRPMFMPVTMGAIAGVRRGAFYTAAKRLPAHDWHAAKGAEFEDSGGWDRPAWYGKDRAACIRRETLLVRESVGLFDASSLGKIEVKGPDAAEFLNRIYVNTVPNLKQGKVRYGLMLNENGIMLDDGVFIRLADDHFLINTTSGNADGIAGWLEEWHQGEWPGMDLVISPVTSQWAVVTVAGPKSRDVLRTLPGMIELSTKQFPHMSFASGVFDDGTPYRIQRVSFTGEMSYELSVPANCATAYFERVWAAGQVHSIGLFGVESLMILRLEKGFLHVGGDTDTTSNPFDAGFRKIVASKQGDFIGVRSLQRAEDKRGDRRQLIGFETNDKDATVSAGAHIVTGHGVTQRSEGFVTSACLSPTLGKTIGLALLERGFERQGETITLYDEGRLTTGRIVDACFYDPRGERMRG